MCVSTIIPCVHIKDGPPVEILSRPEVVSDQLGAAVLRVPRQLSERVQLGLRYSHGLLQQEKNHVYPALV